MSDQYVPDEERDAILDKLLQNPDNKVTLPLLKLLSRFALTVRVRIRSGRLQTLEFSCVTSAPQSTETSEYTSHSLGKLKHFHLMQMC